MMFRLVIGIRYPVSFPVKHLTQCGLVSVSTVREEQPEDAVSQVWCQKLEEEMGPKSFTFFIGKTVMGVIIPDSVM